MAARSYHTAFIDALTPDVPKLWRDSMLPQVNKSRLRRRDDCGSPLPTVHRSSRCETFLLISSVLDLHKVSLLLEA